MATSDPREKTVRQLFARLSARDFDAMAALLAEDVVFDLRYAPEMLPMPTEGRDAVRALVGDVIGGMFEPFAIEVVDVYLGADPDLVFAEYHSEGTVKHNGNRYTNDYIGLFRVDDTGIRVWREYHDPERATKALAG